jgi:hypothetical protein
MVAQHRDRDRAANRPASDHAATGTGDRAPRGTPRCAGADAERHDREAPPPRPPTRRSPRARATSFGSPGTSAHDRPVPHLVGERPDAEHCHEQQDYDDHPGVAEGSSDPPPVRARAPLNDPHKARP